MTKRSDVYNVTMEKYSSQSEKPKVDSVVQTIVERFESRAAFGRQKYGTDLDRTDLRSKIKLHEVNYATDKTVSYSQYATWRACNYQWYLAYAQNNAVYSQSIHTVFGTAIHNTLQYYIDYIFNISGKKADEIDLESYFKTQLTEEYKRGLVQNKNQQYSTPDELREFYEDGCEIIKAFKKDRVKWFGLRGWRLIGCEVPIIYPIAEKSNLFMKGYIDLVLYDEKYEQYYIYDIICFNNTY